MFDLPITQNPSDLRSPSLDKEGKTSAGCKSPLSRGDLPAGKAGLEGFRYWLKSKHYSPSTTRNYLADLNKYLSFANQDPDLNNLFSVNLVVDYIKSINSDPNQDRYLSSLNKFFDFAVDQNLIDTNPIKKILKSNRSSDSSSKTHDLKTILSEFQSYLFKKNKTPATIKNYINDVQQFINWSETQN